MREHAHYLAGATVLITGAAGSIGTELSTRLTRLGIGALVLVDQAETPLVELDAALREDHGFTEVVPVLADIRSGPRALEVVEQHRPDVVFHAAAYKQVPLLEAYPVEGVATNVLGTKHMVAAALRVGVDRFVLLSTDKAVEPASILGQSKAVAEWIVAAAGREAPHTRYTSVRLGNVADSAGSILPLFRRQIARGGPVTVTHPHATRFLMTAAEAAELAIVAGEIGDPNSVLWLDLNPPVRVIDLAQRLVEAASGKVAIELVGLRPGEKLHEQLCSPSDEVRPTTCERVLSSATDEVDPDWLEDQLTALARYVERASAPGVRAALAETLERRPRRLVPSSAVMAR